MRLEKTSSSLCQVLLDRRSCSGDICLLQKKCFMMRFLDYVITLVVQFLLPFLEDLTVLLQAQANDIMKACTDNKVVEVTLANIRDDVENRAMLLY